jgi:hypothetical protein
VTICSHVGKHIFSNGNPIFLRFWEHMFTSLVVKQEGIMGISFTQIHEVISEINKNLLICNLYGFNEK